MFLEQKGGQTLLNIFVIIFRPHKKEEPTILASPATQSPPAKKKSRTPIIIVPSATQSIITLANARNLLEGYKYVSHDVGLFSKIEIHAILRKLKELKVELKAKFSFNTKEVAVLCRSKSSIIFLRFAKSWFASPLQLF